MILFPNDKVYLDVAGMSIKDGYLLARFMPGQSDNIFEDVSMPYLY